MPHHDDRYPHRDHRPGPQAQDRDGRHSDRAQQGGSYGRDYGSLDGGRSGGQPGHDQDDQDSYTVQGRHDRRYDPDERDDGRGRAPQGGSRGRTGYEGDQDHRAYRGGASAERGLHRSDDDLDERSGRDHRHPDYGSRTHDDREAQRSESWSERSNAWRQSYRDHGAAPDGLRQAAGHGGGRDYRHSDPEYHQWREAQIRSLDDDYDAWRQDRYRRFSDEFGAWRSTRQGASTAQAGDGKPASSSGSRAFGTGVVASDAESAAANQADASSATSAGGGSTATGTGNAPGRGASPNTNGSDGETAGRGCKK